MRRGGGDKSYQLQQSGARTRDDCYCFIPGSVHERICDVREKPAAAADVDDVDDAAVSDVSGSFSFLGLMALCKRFTYLQGPKS